MTRLHRSQYTTTKAGIVIGSAFIPQRRLREISSSEEQLQAALLARPRSFRIRAVLLAMAAAAGLALALAVWADAPDETVTEEPIDLSATT